jgi:hypothetical protein
VQRKLACVVLLTWSLGCASGERRSQPARLPSPTPTVAATASTPVADEAAQEIKEGSGKFNQYKFSYKRTGGQVEASFKSPRLPRSDAVVVAAAREVIIAAYADKSENFPRPILWNYQGAEVNAIYLEADNFEYVFVPVKTGGGEIDSLVFWKLKKGTARR